MRGRLFVSLGALALVGIFTYGSRGSLGLFIKPWEEEFGASRGSVSLISSVGFVALGLGQPVAGRLLELMEGRAVLVAGLVLASAGFVGAAFAGELWVALLLIGVVASFGGGLSSLSSLSYLAADLVDRRQGAIFGILTAASAGGQVVVLPIATAALGVSLRASLLTLGVILAVTAIATLALVRPVAPARLSASQGRIGALARIPEFWYLLVPFFVCGYTTTGLIDTHLIPHAVDHHIAETTASSALATLAAFNMAGVLLAGIASDRVDR
ncbi:MAG: MFS transporter, partial [Chloroflexota bacterium]|nr:MFS transporter [Chloroflexota bacterium]